MMKVVYHRRPVWQPSKLSRLIVFLSELLKQLTFRRIVVAMFVLPVLFFIYGEVNRDALVIDKFSLPKRFEESGLTSEVVANRIGDALRQIETNTETRMRKDNPTLLRDEGSTPDVEIPGTKVGLKTLVEISRAVFGIYPKHVSGDIVESAESSPTKPQVTVTVYITQGRARSRALSHVVNANDVGVLAQNAAEMILGQVNPYILAAYRSDHGEGEKADDLLQRMVLDPSEDRGHVEAAMNLLGYVLSEQKKYDEAVAMYQKAIELDPKDVLPYDNWGITLYAQKKYDEATVKFQKAIELDPKYAYTYRNWGTMLYEQKKYDDAASKYQRASELDPNDAATYDNWGITLKEQKKYDQATVKFQKAIELDPKYALAYYNWGNVLYEQKKYDEAVAKLQKAIKLDPKYAPTYNGLGFVLYEQRKYDEAMVKFQKAIELDPKYALAYNNWGNMLYAQKKYDEAASKYQKAIEVDPKYAFAYYNWGNMLYERKKYDEAASKYQRASELDPNDALAYSSYEEAKRKASRVLDRSK